MPASSSINSRGNPVLMIDDKAWAFWTIDDLIVWFAGRKDWTPDQVLAQPMGDLWRIVDAVMTAEERAAMERQKQEAFDAAQRGRR